MYFHLPYFTSRDAQLDFVNVKVWLDSLTGAEAFSRDLHHLQYVYGFNGFYFVELVDFTGAKLPIPVLAGQKFYVGWQQSFGPEVPVGFDKSTDSKHKTFVRTGATWDTSTIAGTVMIRPVLWPDSNYVLIPTDKIAEAPLNQLTIYPNPTKAILNLKLDNYERAAEYRVHIYNAMGQEIYAAPFEEQLNLIDWQTGLYILNLIDEKGKRIAQQKIIKH